ncbi:hypothetical protein BWQ96_03103 [Gracilariopsis chorda]|uniref:Aminoglycoside phosphotransferase domain-containing protein n=1 Tax=Gracilariopsis chorda TaxID=448386 RepID=A0A2V3IYG6_9FLOR|nr:hypothetical protein BWQ96_03103 [Gracilariopsis chorda]|eukprot:PXF47161.1 hypothetical protein BWQ96_03103 [Gracilariopsis chorda]
MAFRYFAMIVHPRNGSILTHRNGKLPVVSYEDDAINLHKMCANLQRLVADAYRLILMRSECEVLLSSDGSITRSSSEYRTQLLIFEIVSDGPLTSPKDFTWTPQNAAFLVVVDPALAPVVEYLQHYANVGLLVNKSRLYPYSHSGWFKEAASWIQSTMVYHGYDDVEEVQQVSSKSEGCVLRGVMVCGSAVYFKQVGTHTFSDEIRATQLLSKSFPDYFKCPIEVNIEKKWMLMPDRGTSFPEDACSVSTNQELFHSVLFKWGTIQKQSLSSAKGLEDAGMELMNGPAFEGLVQKMISDTEWCSVLSEELAVTRETLPVDEAEFKNLFITYTRYLSVRASEYSVPLALVHGDLDIVNVTQNSENEINFIDFGATCISFPFRDAATFALMCGATADDLQFYFDMWVEYESAGRIRELFQLVKGLQLVFSAFVSYKQYITAEESKRMSTRLALRSVLRVLLQGLVFYLERACDATLRSCESST